MSAALRELPSVDAARRARSTPRAPVAVAAARAVIAARRAELLRRASPATADLRRAPAPGRRPREAPSLRRVLNATGVIVHTNLGRAPLAPAAREAVAPRRPRATRTSSSTWRAASAARATTTSRRCCASSPAPRRRSPSTTAPRRCCWPRRLAGAGRSIVVSRGQLVEIGGGFRIPEVVAQSGARLVEVGHDEPHPPGRLRARDRRATRRDPARPPLELPPARLRRGRRDRGALRRSACR